MSLDRSSEPARGEELLAAAVDIASEAGALARSLQTAALNDIDTKSTPTDIVTAADKAVEEHIRTRLRARYPHDAIVGEEAGLETGKEAGLTWIIDPIDGTVNYVYAGRGYAVSLAVYDGSRAIAGVVYEPVAEDLFCALAGEGAWRGRLRDGHRLTGSTATQLDQALVATGFSYDAADRARQATVLAGVLPHVRDIRRYGAAALDLSYAAAGVVDAYYESGLQPWDSAAGALIAREAGLTVTELDLDPGRPTLVAAPTALHAQLEKLLRAASG